MKDQTLNNIVYGGTALQPNYYGEGSFAEVSQVYDGNVFSTQGVGIENNMNGIGVWFWVIFVFIVISIIRFIYNKNKKNIRTYNYKKMARNY